MCKEQRHLIAYVPCKICVVNDCTDRHKHVGGCQFGKPSNEMIKWAFGYTNTLRYEGIKRPS